MSAERSRQATIATARALAVNAILSGAKLVAALAAGSAALLADAVHSLSDIATDAVVLAGVRLSRKPPDDGHHWGHGKIETLASVVVGVILAVAAVQIFRGGLGAVRLVLDGEVLPAPHPLAFGVALISIAAKELLYRYTRAVARRLDSPALLANAWHQRSDALSSAAVAVGIGAAALGGPAWRVLDPLAAMVVAVVIGKVAISILWASVGELLEASVDRKTHESIVCTAASVPGVHDPHAVRARRVGGAVAVDLHVVVPGNMDVREAHGRAAAVEESLMDVLGPGSSVLVHVDPMA